jgi:hypothetical protein
MRHRAFSVVAAVAVCAVASAARAGAERPADQETTNVEVDPITCWWRTSATAVRVGEVFDLTLTCSIVETEPTKVVADQSRLDPTVVQLPPFEVLGGTHPPDMTVPGRRYFQYDYRLRLIAEDAFGTDVAVPPLEITYRIESKVEGGDTVQGRDLTYALPRTGVRVISLVPNDAADIRESPAAAFGAVESRVARGNLMETLATLLLALAGFVVLVMVIGAVRRRTASAAAVRHLPVPRTVIAAAARDLAEVEREGRAGWTPELSARTLAALRIVGSYAAGRGVGQRLAQAGDAAVDGEITVLSRFGRPRAFAAGSVTSESAGDVRGLADALRLLTAARYGRAQALDGFPAEAVATGVRLAKEQAVRHSLMAEWTAALVASVVDVRRKVWT